MEQELEKDMTPKLIGETYLKYPNGKSKCRLSHGIYECQYCNKEFESLACNISTTHSRGTNSCGCVRKKNNTSGYVGVNLSKNSTKWVAYVSHNYKNVYVGVFITKEEAALARDNYILENGLTHKLSGLIKTEKENK